MAIHADKMYTCVGTQDYAHTYDTCGIPPHPSFKIVLLHQKPPPLWVHHSTPPVYQGCRHVYQNSKIYANYALLSLKLISLADDSSYTDYQNYFLVLKLIFL